MNSIRALILCATDFSDRASAAAAVAAKIALHRTEPLQLAARDQPAEWEVREAREVAAAICGEAERFGADPVGLASHGRGVSRAWHGSVTKAVLKQIRRPLLVIRRPDARARDAALVS